MANIWTWQTLDYSKVQPGDIVSDGNQVRYVESVREIPKHVPNVIQHERRITYREYSHEFEWENEKGSGYSFDCFADGSIPNNAVVSQGLTRQQYFEQRFEDSHPTLGRLIYKGIRSWTRTYNEPAVIRCTGMVALRRGTKITGYEECGEEIALDMVMTNTCSECGSDYSSSGSKLAPRSQWGWDTGESVSDILAADWNINESPYDRGAFDYE